VAPAAEDDPRVLRAVEEYLAARQAGAAPDRHAFLARHADVAAALAECLDGLDFLHQAGAPLRPSAEDDAEDDAVAAAAAAPPATLLGDFRLLREVGRGGMGVVYEAEQLSLGRRVALKVLPLAAALDARQLQRFQNEARAAACLHHTHIVPVYGVGCERGVHYYAMQFIDGHTLAALLHQLRREAADGGAGRAGALAEGLASGRWAPPRPAATALEPTIPYTPPPADVPPPPADGPPSPFPTLPAASPSGAGFLRSAAFFRTVAQLGIQAAEAVEHAHQLGVVHRDVKPGNLLVDALGQLWVTDFGLALCQGHPGLTMTGDLVGTLRYMSPEQALAKRVPLDHRTDVYSLGATLYELLTLEPAFDGTDRQELLRQIAFEEPRPPARLNKAVPRELETVVLKAMAKAPAERYATAQELADDLRRFLEDRPVRARRPSVLQWVGKWMRRHRPAVWSAGVAALGLLLTAVAALAWSNVRITREKNAKEAALQEKLAALKDKDAALLTAGRRFYAAQMNLAQQAWEASNPARAIELLEGQRPGPEDTDLRHFEWYYLWHLCHRGHQLTLKAPVPKCWCVAFSPDGKAVATGGPNGAVTLWDAATGRERATWPGHGGTVKCLAFSPDGKTLAAGSHNPDAATLALYDTATGRERASLGRPQGSIWSLAFARDSRTLASGGHNGTVMLWDAVACRSRGTLFADTVPIGCAAFSPDGKTLAAGSAWGELNGVVKVWDVTAARPRVRFELPGAHAVAFSPDGTLLASTGGEGDTARGLRLFDAATGRERLALPGHVGSVYAVAFGPDGKTLASAGNDRTVRLWDPGAGRQLICYAAAGPVHGIAFAPGGTVLASGGDQGTIHLWDTAPGREDRVLANAGPCVAFSPDGKTLATSGRATKLWDLSAWTARTIPSPAGATPTRALVFSHDGKTLAAARGPAVRLLDVAARRECGALEGTTDCWSVAFSPDDRTLASASNFVQAVSLWDVSTRHVRATVTPHRTGVAHAVDFSPDGKLLATGSMYGVVKLWDAATGEERATLQPGEAGGMNWTWAVAFSADGALLATADRQGLVRVWDVASGGLRATLRGHTDSVEAVAFSPDGTTLATGGEDRLVKLWDVATGQERITLKGHPARILSVAFSPDGTLLATGSWNGTVRVWRAAPDAEARARRPGSHEKGS
jgi:WD40 repeat protein/serine/threonine protein kinase